MNIVRLSQLDRSRPGTWPIYYQVLIWVAIAVVLSFLYLRFVHGKLADEQDSLDNQINNLVGQYDKLYQYSVDLPAYREHKKQLVGQLQEYLTYLPSETEMPSLVDEIYQTGSQNGIVFSALTPGQSSAKTYYNLEPISLATKTSYDSFAHFAEQIASFPRILNVQNFDMKVEDDSPSGIAINSILETYIYNQDISKYLGEGQ
ncbi:type 4a pilus biogenesis protein PilO [Suttonella sp. R2A3]|uniref:type 4a pilus biogenesis protein PilO n=1 Tax=Suttonella sp. R2A3 TaxID=2908648 RepID=UPI001F2E7D12|nr:type 4a pilus biogenesis protein PilO [Suttonella sp. R2A3]UJF25107.1 type 4a pilus biogenesis protein PilO [Suttonella sp. R2A3]